MNIVAIGEILWDLFPAGPQLGGTTANFTVHARGLGANASLISRVGHDPRGEEALRLLRERGIPTHSIQVDPSAPTGTVEVKVAADGQPAYRIIEDVAWDRIAVDDAARAAVAVADAICFGTLAQRSEPTRSTIRELLSLAKPGCLRVFDVNLRTPFWSTAVIEESLRLADVVKLNFDELEVVAGMLGLSMQYFHNVVVEMSRRYSLKMVALTCGAKGSVLYTDRFVGQPSVAVDVVDTVGAGDSFAAVLTIGLLQGWPPEVINERASRVAAYVCSQRGATPLLPTDLLLPGERGA